MKNTTNYGLKKPESTDFYNVDDMNENMDIIDEKLKELEEGGGGDVSTVKYDATTDMVYVLDADGKWVEWLSGGLVDFNVFSIGVDEWTKVNSKDSTQSSSQFTFNTNPFSFITYAKSYNMNRETITSPLIDLTGKKKWIIAGQSTFSTVDGTGSDNKSGEIRFLSETGSVLHTIQFSGNKTINETINFDVELRGKYKVEFYEECYATTNATTSANSIALSLTICKFTA